MLCASVLVLLLFQGCYRSVARLLPRCCQAAPSLLPSSRARCYVHLPRPSGATPVESEASRDALKLRLWSLRRPGRSGARPVKSEGNWNALELRLSSLRPPGTLWSYACRV